MNVSHIQPNGNLKFVSPVNLFEDVKEIHFHKKCFYRERDASRPKQNQYLMGLFADSTLFFKGHQEAESHLDYNCVCILG